MIRLLCSKCGMEIEYVLSNYNNIEIKIEPCKCIKNNIKEFKSIQNEVIEMKEKIKKVSNILS